MSLPQAPVAYPGECISLFVTSWLGSCCAGLIQNAGVKGHQDGACSLHLGSGVVDHISNLQATVYMLCKGKPQSLLVPITVAWTCYRNVSCAGEAHFCAQGTVR